VKASNQKNPKVYPPVGRCVFCVSDGSPDGLSTEHIVAYGLTGSGLLPKASCASCRDITGQIEQTCLRVNFIDYRVHGKLATRRPKERPTVLPVRLTIDGKIHTQHVPVDQHPALLYMPVLPKPGIFSGIGPSSELRVSTMFCAYDPNDVKTKLERISPNAKLAQETQFHLQDFIRMLAKIAHCYAVAELGLDSLNALLPPLILGHDLTLSQYLVGGTDLQIPAPQFGAKERNAGLYTLHQLHLGIRPLFLDGKPVGRGLVTATIRLFAIHNTPLYEVVVGELNPKSD
jgi:hypothetical protein